MSTDGATEADGAGTGGAEGGPAEGGGAAERGGPAAPGPDPLAELRARIAATREAAERLGREADAAAAQARAGHVPPQGWATPEDRERSAEEVRALAQLLGALRELVPAELQLQVSEVVRQLLLLLRQIIDWWVDRLAPGAEGAAVGPTVEDVPIL